MKELLIPALATLIGALLGGGLVLAIIQRHWGKQDKKVNADLQAEVAILEDGTKIRTELWTEIGRLRGELTAVQNAQSAGLEERYQLRLSIKELRQAEEHCEEKLKELNARLSIAERRQEADELDRTLKQ